MMSRLNENLKILAANTWLPTKDETSKTTVGNLFRPFLTFKVPCRPKLAYFCDYLSTTILKGYDLTAFNR